MSGPIDRRLLLACAAWLVLATAGFASLVAYAARPGPVIAKSSTVTPGRPQLLVVLHPRCACSRATLTELERILARVGDRIDARLVFVGPDGGDHALLDRARQIRGVTIEEDASGIHATALGAATSGDAFFYDAAGRLAFHGGLTIARGHEGAGAAYDAILALVAGRPPATRTTATFGCSLRSPS